MLQINANAEPETVHRVYRLLAQRYHPDNKDTGDATRFRTLTEAYEVLSDPEQRAKYDVVHQQFWRDRWKIAEGANDEAADFRAELWLGRAPVLDRWGWAEQELIAGSRSH